MKSLVDTSSPFFSNWTHSRPIARQLIRNLTLILVVGLVILLMNLPLLARFLAPPPLAYVNVPFPVLNGPYHPGMMLRLIVTRCSAEPDGFTYTVTRRLKRLDGGIMIALESTFSMVNTGCTTMESQQLRLPDQITEGLWVLEGVAVVHGHWRDMDVPFSSQPFLILPEGVER